MAGSLVGESVGYLLGRRFGDRLRSSRLGRRLGEQHWAKAEGFLNGRGGRAVFAARFVAVVYALLPVVAGTVGMSVGGWRHGRPRDRWGGRWDASAPAPPQAHPGGSTATGSDWPAASSSLPSSPWRSWPGRPPTATA